MDRASLLLLVALLAGCGGATASSSPPCPAAGEPAPELRFVVLDRSVERRDVPIEGRPAKGADAPLVTLVEITDFECPFCERVQPTIARLLDEHPEVRLVVRNNPLPMHRYAVIAAEAALEAYAQGGDAAFFRMHDVLFANQRALAPEDLVRYAGEVGLDVDRFVSALERGVHRPVLVEDVELAMAVGASGTPTFFANGRPIVGALPYEEFDAIVREEIEAARALEAQGVPRARLYEAFRAAARRPPPEPPTGEL